MTSYTTVTDDVSNNLASYHNELIAGLQGMQGPRGWMQNGYISVTVASNNLTLAIKNLAGNDPSASDPVAVRIGNTIRLITAALSVTKNAGTNWCNAGGTELAAQEIDYFAYIGYNATDGVVLGFSRIPWGTAYGSFSTTTTAETYAAISTITTAASTDEYQVIGRFAATLSAGAGYTWTVPTFTPTNLIQRPVYTTRWLTWTPAWTASGSLTYTSVTNNVAQYKLVADAEVHYRLRATGTLGGSASNILYATVPFEIANPGFGVVPGSGYTAGVAARVYSVSATPDQIAHEKYDSSNYATSGACVVASGGFYAV